MAAKVGPMTAYVGCYTLPRQADPFADSPNGGVPHDESKTGAGILAVNVSPGGNLSFPSDAPSIVVNSVPNPSYLATLEGRGSPGEETYVPRRLCVVSEGEDGTLHMFSIAHDDPTKLIPLTIEALPTGGSYPCHVIAARGMIQEAPKEDIILVCNYGSNEVGGTFTVYRKGKTGTAFEVAETVLHGTQGARGDSNNRQIASHAHSCACANGDAYVADLGLDAIIRYSYQSGSLRETGRLALPSGSGPRSMTFNPHPQKSHIASVSLEMSAEVALMQVRKHDKCLEVLGSPYSVLPPGWPEYGNPMAKYNNGKWVSDSVWSRNGELLLVAARLHNSIAMFRLKESSLLFLGRIPTGGITPRCLTVCGDILLVAHQHSHDITSFRINEATGELVVVDKIDAPLAACIK